jgi:hypothetical protein
MHSSFLRTLYAYTHGSVHSTLFCSVLLLSSSTPTCVSSTFHCIRPSCHDRLYHDRMTTRLICIKLTVTITTYIIQHSFCSHYLPSCIHSGIFEYDQKFKLYSSLPSRATPSLQIAHPRSAHCSPVHAPAFRSPFHVSPFYRPPLTGSVPRVDLVCSRAPTQASPRVQAGQGSEGPAATRELPRSAPRHSSRPQRSGHDYSEHLMDEKDG